MYNIISTQTGVIPQAIHMQAQLNIYTILSVQKLVSFHKLFIWKDC